MKIAEILTDRPECPNVRFLNVEGLQATQSHKVLNLLKALKEEGFELALEIGTQQGGFTLLLKEYLRCDVYTWDIHDYPPASEKKELFKKYGITQRLEDCFEDPKLISLLRDDRKKIVFCDGGHKGNEFNSFARLLNNGDFIGAHDYFETLDDRDNDVWTTCELTYEEIRGAVEENHLEQKYRDLSLASVWALYKKTVNPRIKRCENC